MQGKTHLVFGILVGLILVKTLHFNELSKYLFFILLIIGSLLPDIDTPNSTIGRRTRVSHVVNFLTGHRGILHSLDIPIVLAILILFTGGLIKISIYGLTIGYLTHLFLDALTKEGIIILWPFKARARGSIKTNSFIDNFTFYVLTLAIIAIILKAI